MALRLGRYFWKLFLANALVMAVVLAVSVWVIVSQLDQFRQEELSRHLFAQASALEVAVRDRFDLARAADLNALAKQVGSTEHEGVRVTFVLADGTVLGDSEANAAEMESHADRPEIQQALAAGSGESVRWSHTVAKYMDYVAVRVGSGDNTLGVVRLSMAVESIAALSKRARRLAVTMAGVSVLAAALLACALALLWSRPIRLLTEAARSISGGDLSARVEVVGTDEVAALGRSLNEMREKLSTHVDTIDRQRRTLDSLVSQLREGVVVADAAGRIVLVNAEAIGMLQPTQASSEESYVGKSVEQFLPHHKLQNLLCESAGRTSSGEVTSPAQAVNETKRSFEESTQEVELRLSTATGDRTVLARAFDVRLPADEATSSSETAAAQVGRALLLTDITELSKVMQVKADLAANASHELRTPLSAIRAAVDTLHSIDGKADADQIAQLIDVVDRHSGRMEAMIGDLLELSRLESGTGRFDAVRVSGATVLKECQESFASAVAAKKISWTISTPTEDVSITTSAALLGIILRNLIENAIRFTPTGGEIKLSVRKEENAVAFEVTDTGCGIARVDQDRIFERFYQVEQARSGPNRGTGLGLSIVRPAAAAIGARIELESAIGVGTRMTIHVPR